MTAGGHREEREVVGEEEYRVLLKTHFGVDLGEGVRVDRFIKLGMSNRRNSQQS
ncbi:MAG: hypothetical protein EXQ55_06450 [Acidobacteria bacterium]|nr:hypothetical protein [Acidobacteriota bacterium]